MLVPVLALAALPGCGRKGATITETEPVGSAIRPIEPTKPDQLSQRGMVNLSLAQTYLKSGQLKTALERANQAAMTDPRNGNVYAMMGLIQDRIGDQAAAAAAFQKALSLAPTEGGVNNAYGIWQCSRGDQAGAAASFARALADPFFTSPGLAHFNAGHCLLKSGQAAQAEVELRRALDTRGSDVGAVLMSLAQAELAQGSVFEARAFVQRREALGATAEVLELAARIEDAAGDPAAAARIRARIRGDRAESDNGG
jgi:type IV pilus assembly protein PilF